MAQAEPANSIELTKKGERVVAEQAAARSLAIAEKRRIRLEAADEIDRLMSILDRLDGDPDLEDTHDDEPSIGPGIFREDAEVPLSLHGNADDLELDMADAEPSLGWTGAANQTSRQRLGELDDAEHDRADFEDTGDREDGGDAEADPAEVGIADEDGLHTPPAPEYKARLNARRGTQPRPPWPASTEGMTSINPAMFAPPQPVQFEATRNGVPVVVVGEAL